MRGKSWFFHLVAFITVAIWGSTFVFTKMLLQNGLSPAQIFTLRFAIAYLLLLGFNLITSPPKLGGVRGGLNKRFFRPLLSPPNSGGEFRLFTSSWKDELLMLVLGISGGSVYFLAENAAMLFTTATNTSLLVCSCPLFAMLLVAIVYRHSEHISKLQALGSVVACMGMAVVVLNGHFVLHLSPLGDLLAFGACLCWAFYSLLMKSVVDRYSTLFITRKVFFYGLLTIIPYYIFVPGFPSLEVLMRPEVLLNLLFLGVVASMICYILWNWVISKLGAVVATNWVYFNPITTIIFAWWLLHEQITLWFLLGTVLILVGMYLADKRR